MWHLNSNKYYCDQNMFHAMHLEKNLMTFSIKRRIFSLKLVVSSQVSAKFKKLTRKKYLWKVFAISFIKLL